MKYYLLQKRLGRLSRQAAAEGSTPHAIHQGQRVPLEEVLIEEVELVCSFWAIVWVAGGNSKDEYIYIWYSTNMRK
jgi:hypothetical protein